MSRGTKELKRGRERKMAKAARLTKMMTRAGTPSDHTNYEAEGDDKVLVIFS
jgi:hypothetical protein